MTPASTPERSKNSCKPKPRHHSLPVQLLLPRHDVELVQFRVHGLDRLDLRLRLTHHTLRLCHLIVAAVGGTLALGWRGGVRLCDVGDFARRGGLGASSR